LWGKELGRTEDDVGAVQPGGDDGGDEELGAVGVLPGVRHGQEAGLGVLEGEVLIYIRNIADQRPAPDRPRPYNRRNYYNVPANFSP
jgi:hypothetical protein